MGKQTSSHKLTGVMSRELPYIRRCSEWCRNLGMQHQKAYTNCYTNYKAELPCNRHCPEWYGEAQGQIQHQKAYRNCKQNCHTKDIALNGAGKLVIAASGKFMGIASRTACKRHCPEWYGEAQGQIQHQKAYRNCKQNCHTKDIALNGAGKLMIAASGKFMGIASRTACKRHCPEWYGEAQGQIQHLESLQEFPYKRCCTECCGEDQDCSIRKACRDCKQNCGTKTLPLR